MNLVFVFVAGILVWFNKKYLRNHSMKMMEMEGGGKIKKWMVSLFILINVLGLSVFAYHQFL